MGWKLLSIAMGGSLGAMLRFVISHFQGKYFDTTYPWATFLANLIGAFFIGIFWGFFEKSNISANVKSFILIGVIGSFTTFSTLSLETVKLFESGNTKIGLLYIGATNILGIFLVIIGLWISRQMIN